MDSSATRLRELLLSPAEPAAATPWAQAMPEAGLRFPRDYREFVDCYGGGLVNREFGIVIPKLHPFQPGAKAGFSGFAQFAAEQVAPGFPDLGVPGPEPDPYRNPYPFFPAAGGLLIWARDYNGDHCFWLTEHEDPDRWPVVVFFRNMPAPQWRLFDGGMTQFLLALLDRSYEYAELLIGPVQAPRWDRLEDWARRYDVG